MCCLSCRRRVFGPSFRKSEEEVALLRCESCCLSCRRRVFGPSLRKSEKEVALSRLEEAQLGGGVQRQRRHTGGTPTLTLLTLEIEIELSASPTRHTLNYARNSDFSVAGSPAHRVFLTVSELILRRYAHLGKLYLCGRLAFLENIVVGIKISCFRWVFQLIARSSSRECALTLFENVRLSVT